jgi:hypothetical protein
MTVLVGDFFNVNGSVVYWNRRAQKTNRCGPCREQSE